MNSLYGNFRTQTFNNIYENVNDFTDEFYFYSNIGLNPEFSSQTTISTIFYLLSANYGNSSIVNLDENQFKLKLFSIIYQYGPTWEKRLDIQKKLRSLSEKDIISGSKVIYNHANNPGTSPSTDDLTELPYINEQNTNNYVKNKIEGYANLTNLLETDVTQEFISKFKKLFMTIVEPELPLWYVTDIEEE